MKIKKHEVDCKGVQTDNELDDNTEESDIFSGTTANYQETIQVDETDESKEEYGGILSLRWPVDHKTTCGLCGTSFTKIGPNGSHYEDIYCPDGWMSRGKIGGNG